MAATLGAAAVLRAVSLSDRRRLEAVVGLARVVLAAGRAVHARVAAAEGASSSWHRPVWKDVVVIATVVVVPPVGRPVVDVDHERLRGRTGKDVFDRDGLRVCSPKTSSVHGGQVDGVVGYPSSYRVYKVVVIYLKASLVQFDSLLRVCVLLDSTEIRDGKGKLPKSKKTE
jgi:hypothetical protein